MKKYVETSFKDYNIPSKLPQFIPWLQERVAETGVPVDEVTIAIDYEDNYGAVTGLLTLSYQRDETKGEEAERETREAQTEDWERKQFERLRKKFGKEE